MRWSPNDSWLRANVNWRGKLAGWSEIISRSWYQNKFINFSHKWDPYYSFNCLISHAWVCLLNKPLILPLIHIPRSFSSVSWTDIECSPVPFYYYQRIPQFGWHIYYYYYSSRGFVFVYSGPFIPLNSISFGKYLIMNIISAERWMGIGVGIFGVTITLQL